jgi:phage FluMu gp28-like protein
MKINYTRPPISAYQKEIIDDPARFTVTEAATKTGKTASHIIWLFEQPLILKPPPGSSVWWVAPVFGQSEIAYRRMKNQVSDRNYFKANDTRLILTDPQGVMYQFRSAERPDNLYGDDVFAAVFDEFTRAREEAWFALRTTLTATKGKCKFIGNVKGKKNWGYRLAQKAKQGDDPVFSYHKITAYQAAEAGYVDFEEIEQAKRDLPDTVFKELYLAEASEEGSNPFGYKFIQLCAIGLSTLPPVCFGIDLAKSSDWTVIIGLDQFGQVCYFDRFQRDWMQTVNVIKALPRLPMRIDSTGVGDPITEQVQQGRENVFSFKFTQTSKQQIMEGLALGIQQRKVLFPEGPIKDELENFEFEYTRTGVRYSVAAGLFDDCVCALALAYDLHKEAVRMGSYSWA